VKLVPGSRRIRLALIAALPITATAAIFGGASPASAWVVGGACGTYQVCYYGNINYAPTSEVLNIGQQDVGDWTNITPGASVACTQGGGNGNNWNDCASSIKSKMTTNNTCVYENVSYEGQWLLITHGARIPDLTQVGRNGGNWNDVISSSIWIIPGQVC
jgi:hypothetical protein